MTGVQTCALPIYFFDQLSRFIERQAHHAGITALDLGDELTNRKLDLSVAIRVPKKQLPWLNNWQHWGKGEYVVGLEPGTNPVIGQAKARAQNELLQIAPGQTMMFDLAIEVIHDNSDRLNELLKHK